MTLSEIRRILRSMQRKLALPLAVIRMRRATEQICNDWAVALELTRRTQRDTLPHSHDLVRTIVKAGYAGGYLTSFHRYVQRCLEKDECPEPSDMVRALLPQAIKNGLIHKCFRWDLDPTD